MRPPFEQALVRALSVALPTVLMTACSAPPPARPKTTGETSVVAGQIENGRSTRADVLDLLGDPTNRVVDANGLEQWLFWSTEEVGGRYAHTRLVVEFGADGTVQRVTSSRVAP